MPYDSAAGKALVRRTVHKTFGLAAFYWPEDADPSTDEPVELRVRWHNKITPRGDHGDLFDIGYPEVIEGVDQLIFDRDELVEKDVILKPGDLVEIRSPNFNNARLRLNTQHPQAGPFEIVWRVSNEGTS